MIFFFVQLMALFAFFRLKFSAEEKEEQQMGTPATERAECNRHKITNINWVEKKMCVRFLANWPLL